MKINLSKTQIFFVALLTGLILGNLLTTISNKSEKETIAESGNEVLQILYETKMKQNKDSIWYNQEIEKLSQLLYESESRNHQNQK